MGVAVTMVAEIGVTSPVVTDFDCERVFPKFGDTCCVDATWKGVAVATATVGFG